MQKLGPEVIADVGAAPRADDQAFAAKVLPLPGGGGAPAAPANLVAGGGSCGGPGDRYREGRVQTYVNPLGTAFAPVQETKAFWCT